MDEKKIELFLKKVFIHLMGDICGDSDHLFEELSPKDMVDITRELGFNDLANKMRDCDDKDWDPKEDDDFDACEHIGYNFEDFGDLD